MRTAIKAIDWYSMEANLHLDNKRHMQQKMRTHDRVAPAGDPAPVYRFEKV